jgi:hypothetical protein
MIEYKVGEVFTTDEGKIVQCVRSNGLCSGCVFLTKIGDAPRCKAMYVDCSECSREDDQHVIFEELEELKEHTEYPVGKLLTFKGKVVEVVGNNDEKSCYDCALFFHDRCNYVNCVPVERMDGEHIKFVEHVTAD